MNTLRTLTFCALAAVLVSVSLVGCSGDKTEGKDVPAAVTDSMAKMGAAAKRTNGDWNALTEEEKKLFLERTNGNEANAQAMLKVMVGGGGPRGPVGK